jgi:hypothetical protein
MKYHKQEEARPSLNIQKERQIIMVRTGKMNHSATLLYKMSPAQDVSTWIPSSALDSNSGIPTHTGTQNSILTPGIQATTPH